MSSVTDVSRKFSKYCQKNCFWRTTLRKCIRRYMYQTSRKKNLMFNLSRKHKFLNFSGHTCHIFHSHFLCLCKWLPDTCRMDNANMKKVSKIMLRVNILLVNNDQNTSTVYLFVPSNIIGILKCLILHGHFQGGAVL